MILNYKTQGSGPPILVLHGLFGMLDNWKSIANQLETDYSVYLLDLRNHGRSPHVETMSLHSMAQDLRSWMDQQGLASAHFVGHSLGGKAVMELALEAPERCQKLAVIDIAPVAYGPHHTDVFAGLAAVDVSALTHRSQADVILQPYVPELAVRSFLLKNLSKGQQGFSWRMNLPVIHRDYPALIAANRTTNTPFSGDVLFVKGGDSAYILEEHRQAITARFSNAKLRRVTGTGHWLHAEKPEHVAQLLVRFLAGA